MKKGNLFTILFFLFWFGFLTVAAYICIRDKQYGMLLYSGIFCSFITKEFSLGKPNTNKPKYTRIQ